MPRDWCASVLRSCLVLWHDAIDMSDKPTSEQLRLESEKLREIATDLLEHAALLINKSIELEKRIANRHTVSAR